MGYRGVILYLILLGVFSALVYSPMYSSDDELFKGYGISLYLCGGPIVLFIIMAVTVRKVEKTVAKVLLVAGSLLLFAAPPSVDWGQEQWEEFVRDHQEVTADMLLRAHYYAPEQFIPPMRNLRVNVVDGHVNLEMEYNPYAYGGQTMLKANFQDRLLVLLSNQMHSLSEYVKLSALSVRVTYYDQVFVFEGLPLKDSKGKTLRESDELESNRTILINNMKVLTLAGGLETP
jgi:hypothetical protein